MFFAPFVAIKESMIFELIVQQNIDWSTALGNA